MNMKKLATVVIIALSATTAAAADAASKASYEAAKKQAATRYAEDKNLCAEETSSSARMQCLRDAKAEYKKALTAAKQATSAQPVARTSGVCAECGKVTSVKVVEKEGEGSPLGVIAGGVAGAVLGHQVGGGSGKDLATIAGAAGGAYAGHKIEQKVRSKKLWVVNVQFENGDERSFNFENDPGYAAGDAVKQTGNNIVRR